MEGAHKRQAPALEFGLHAYIFNGLRFGGPLKPAPKDRQLCRQKAAGKQLLRACVPAEQSAVRPGPTLVDA